MRIDTAAQYADTLYMSGWAISRRGSDAITRIDVYLDEQSLGNASHGQSRADIGHAYPAVPGSSQAGFTFQADIARLVGSNHSRKHKITVCVSDDRGHVHKIARVFRGQAEQSFRPQVLSVKNDYEQWRYRNRLTPKMEAFFRAELNALAYRPTFSIIMPVHNTPSDLLIKALDSIQTQIYPQWEACIVNDGSTESAVNRILSRYAQRDRRYTYQRLETNQGIVAASNAALAVATGEYVVFMDSDDTLEPDALFQIAAYLQNHRDLDVIYTDNDKIDMNDAPVTSQFRPDWSPELLYSYCYIVHLKIFRTRLVRMLGGLRPGFEGSQDYDLLLRAAELTRKIGHIPLTLYHWREVPGQRSAAEESIEHGRLAVEQALRRQGIDWVNVVHAEFAKPSHNGIYQLVPAVPLHDTISIIINVKNNVRLVKACLDSIAQKTTYPYYEIILTDDESDDPATIAYLQNISRKHTVLWLKREPGQGFNFAKLNNIAAQATTGDYLVFLNGDTEVISPTWLEEMLLYCRMPEVGIAGAKLLFPNGTIQHAGVITGFFHGLACHAFKNAPATERGYMEFAVVARNYSAVTAACLMINKNLFFNVGGFDEINLPIAYNDVDLCLRVLQHGQRIVYTPSAELLHYEGSFRGNTLSGAQNIHEEIYFRKTWNRNVDPYYNLNHSLQNEDTFKHATAKNTRLALFDLTRRPINILSVSHNLNFEGAPLIKFSVDQYLHRQNHIALHVLCLKVKNGPLGEYYSQAQIPIDIIDLTWNSNPGGYQKFQHEIRQYLRQGGFDLVYTNTLETFWAIEAAHAEGIPSVWNILESIDYHQYFDEYQMDPQIRTIAKQTFVKANRHIFGSQATARLFQRYDYYGTSQIIYNNIHTQEIETLRQVDNNRLKQELHVPSDKKIVSIIGTVCPRKGQLDFAKAAATILKRRNDVCFYIVGVRHEDYLHSYLTQIQKVCARQAQIFLVDETPEALKYFRISDIFVCASYNESFPIVTLEAMGFGLPIVTTPVFGIAEQIVDGKTGLFVEPGDIAAMQQHIEKLLDNPQLAENLGMNAWRVATTNFSEQEMLEKYCRLMEIVACEDVNQG